MKIYITMAGESSRFKKAGFSLPKFMLTVKGKTIFEWSMESLSDWFDRYEFVFILREHSSFVETMCNKLGIVDYSIRVLKSLTLGQAETVYHVLPETDEAIAIYNIDTYVKNLSQSDMDELVDGIIPVFSAEGDHWSFIEFDQNYIITQIQEKVRISEWATVGFYYFRSSNDYKKYYEATFNSQFKGEYYISYIYQSMIRANKRLKTTFIDPTNLVPLGTPAECQAFDLEFMKNNL